MYPVSDKFEDAKMKTHTIDAEAYYFHMLCLLYKLDVYPYNPHSLMRYMILHRFHSVIKKHTGLNYAHYMYGKTVDCHGF